MEIKIENLVSYEKLKSELDLVLEMVESNGQVVILKENAPVFIIQKYEARVNSIAKSFILSQN